MKRVERLLREARLMRARRAARVQGLLVDAPEFDWLIEAGSINALLVDLSEKEVPEGDARRKEPVDVFDEALLAPFAVRASDAIVGLIEEMRPVEGLADSIWERVVALLRPKQVAIEDADAAALRRVAAVDVAALAVQTILLEVMHDVVARMDAG